MKRPRIPLYEFLPYGAPELLEVREPYLTRALSTATLALVAVFLVFAALAPRLAGRTIELPVQGPVDFIPAPRFPLPPQLVPPAPPRPAPQTQGVPVPAPVREESVIVDDEPPPAAEDRGGTGKGRAEDAQRTEAMPPVEILPTLGDFVLHDVEPAVAVHVQPIYPDLAREAGVDGVVKLRVLVDVAGHVRNVHVDRSVPLLDEAAISAVRKWVFTPALASGHPVAVWVAVTVRFNLH